MAETGGKVVLVSGGAAGLGREICAQMAALGWRIACADIDREGARRAAEEMARTTEADWVEVDLASAEGPGRMVHWAVERFGKLDVLVNNAGILHVERFTEMTPEVWERTLNLNVRGVALAMSAAAEVMIGQKSGRIINITSPASRFGVPLHTAYAASKAAVDSLTRSGSATLAPHGIPVNSVAPGMMDTQMHRNLEVDMAAMEGIEDVQGFHDERTGRIPMGRRAEVSEVAKAVVWLATDAPSYITAERLHVAGGFDKD